MGYEINWHTAKGNSNLFKHELYIKYNNLDFANIDIFEVQTDLNGIIATAESAEICAYLSWLIRTLNLLM